TVYRRPIDSAYGTVSYAAGSGTIEFEARGSEPVLADYRVDGEFRRTDGGLDVWLWEVRARDWIGHWRLASPMRLQIGRHGVALADLRIVREDGAGHVHASGTIPWRSGTGASVEAPVAANFRLELERVPVAPFDVHTGGPETSAYLTGTVTLAGTAEDPVMEATLALDSVAYQAIRIDRIGATLAYEDRRLEGRLDASLSGRTVLTGTGYIPVDLTL